MTRDEKRIALQRRIDATKEQELDALRAENAKLRAALEGVIRIADRKTDEFDAARDALHALRLKCDALREALSNLLADADADSPNSGSQIEARAALKP